MSDFNVVPVNKEQFITLKERANKYGKGDKHTRFLANGHAINPFTGVKCAKGCNVIYHPVIWDLTTELVQIISDYLQGNNPYLTITHYN